jgi:hypothetical protein
VTDEDGDAVEKWKQVEAKRLRKTRTLRKQSCRVTGAEKGSGSRESEKVREELGEGR